MENPDEPDNPASLWRRSTAEQLEAAAEQNELFAELDREIGLDSELKALLFHEGVGWRSRPSGLRSPFFRCAGVAL